MPESKRDPLPSRVEQRIEAQRLIAQRMRTAPVVPTRPAPFVTIARQYGCEAMSLAEELSAAMPGGPWPIYNRQIFEKMAEETHVSEKLLDGLDVHTRNGIEEFFQNLLGPSPSDLKLLHQLVRTVRALGVLGHCIIVGRGASALTAGLAGGIHVRLIAPREWREQNLTERFGWTVEHTNAVLREEEHGHHSFFSKYLGKDPQDPELYDLVMNVSRLSRAEEIATVMGLYHARFAR